MAFKKIALARGSQPLMPHLTMVKGRPAPGRIVDPPPSHARIAGDLHPGPEKKSGYSAISLGVVARRV